MNGVASGLALMETLKATRNWQFNCTFRLPQLSEPSNGFYQSVDDTKERGKQNNGQEDASETELKNRPLSSFQNSAYQSTSMNSGLDVAKDCETPM